MLQKFKSEDTVVGPFQKGNNVLRLVTLEVPRKRLDGEMAHFGLDHFMLNQFGDIAAFDYILLTKKEAVPLFKSNQLFEHFDLF